MGERPTTPTREEHFHLLDIATNAWASVNAICWQAFSVFAAGVAVLAAGVAQSSQRGAQLVLLVAGLAASIVWGSLQARLLGHLELHEKRLHRLEDGMELPPNLSVSQRNQEGHRAIAAQSVSRVRTSMLGIICVIGLVWFVALIWRAAQ